MGVHVTQRPIWGPELAYPIETQELKDETDNYIAPDKELTTESVQFVRNHIAGNGRDFLEWKDSLKKYDMTTACGKVWGSEYIAYRSDFLNFSPSIFN